MIANLLNSNELLNSFDVRFVYRYSRDYYEGASRRFDIRNAIPVELKDKSIWEKRGVSECFFIGKIQSIYRLLIFLVERYFSIWKSTRILEKVFSAQGCDVLHINNGGYPGAVSCFAAVFAAKRCGIKRIVYVVNNQAMDYSSVVRRCDRFLDKRVKKLVTVFVTGSDNAGCALRRVLCVESRKQITIRNGIACRYPSLTPEQIRNQYGIDGKSKVISMIAILEERKGHKFFLEAASRIVSNGFSNVIFLIEGKGPLLFEIQAGIEEYSLKDYVKIVQADNVYNIYSITDILVLPSIRNEDFPNVIIEAMGMGIPVIGTTIAGIPEQIDDGINGFLVPPADSSAIYVAIRSLLDDHKLYQSCAENAKRKFVDNYTAEISVRNYIKLYKDILCA